MVTNRKSASCSALLVSILLLLSVTATSTNAQSSVKYELIAAKTTEFKEKQGFERPTKDIINTLKDNEYSSFQTLLDGLQQAFDLDKTLKNKGPFTLLAPTDTAFNKIPSDDLKSLFANKKKLKQVLSYEIVSGKLSAKTLRSTKSIRTMEGHTLTVENKNGDIYVDKALVRIADIPCSNGVIHILDRVIMPPLSK